MDDRFEGRFIKATAEMRNLQNDYDGLRLPERRKMKLEAERRVDAMLKLYFIDGDRDATVSGAKRQRLKRLGRY